MSDQRGGILSKLFITLPAIVVLMAGVFALGYYLGRHEGKTNAAGVDLPPLPEVVSKNLPRPEEFTFYKTLTAKDDKTVSIDLRPKSTSTEGTNEKKQADGPPKQAVLQAPKERETAVKSGKKAVAQQPAGMNAAGKAPEPQKKDSPSKEGASSKLRYSVQISSHQERQAADLEVKKMKHQGFAAFIVSSELPGKGSWYRVRVGSFTSKVLAEKLQKEVRVKTGVSPIVVTE